MPGQLSPRGKGARPPQPRQAATKKTAKKKATARKRSPSKGSNDYIRNRHYVDVRITLSEDNNERRIELKPRGQRGDLARVSKDEQADTKLDWTLVERLSADDARGIMESQVTNQQAPHAALEALRNAHGQRYEAPPQVSLPFEQQGQVVATTEATAATGRLQQGERMVRAPGAAPQQVPVPGSVQNPVPVPPNIPPEQVADWFARQGIRATEADAVQAADALRNSLNVSMNPTQQG